MKAFLAILIILTSFIPEGKGNEQADNDLPTHYLSGIHYINTGTGQDGGLALSMSVLKGRKSLGAGFIYSEQENRFAGINVNFRIYPGDINRINTNSGLFIPYLSYNMILQKGTSNASDIIQLEEEVIEIPGSQPGIVATIGHYIGPGVQVNVFERLYLDVSAGFGIYQGSLDKLQTPKTAGWHFENHGYTYSCNIAIGFRINK